VVVKKNMVDSFQATEKENDPFLDYLSAKGLSENTIYLYSTYYKRFKQIPFTQESIDKFFSNRKRNNTISRSFLKSLLEFLGLTDQFNMPPKITGAKKKKIIRDISPKQITEVRRTAYNKSYMIGLMFDMLYYGALRRSEVGDLRVNSFNWDAWLEDMEQPCELKIEKAKGNKDRVVLMPSQVMKKFLENYLKMHKISPNSLLDLTSTLNTTPNPIFMQHNGGKLQGWTIWNIIKNLSRDAIKIEIRPHELRHCLKEDCEILTNTGWKKYNEISIGEQIFSFNPKKEIIELKPITNIFIYDFNGKINHIKNSWLDYSCTEKHNLILQIGKEKSKTINGKRVRKDIYGNWEIIELNKLSSMKGLKNIRHKLSSHYDGENSIGKARAGILGWILTDGNMSKRKSTEITISQSLTANKKKCEYIENLLQKGNIPYTKTITSNVGGFSSTPFLVCKFYLLKGGNHSNNIEKMGKNHDWIFKFINKNRTPKWNLLNLKKEELKELHKCMMMGDGTRDQEFCNQDNKRIEFFRILCCFLGLNTILGSKIQNGKRYARTYIQKKNYCQLNLSKHLSQEDYKGKVWCISNDNKSFIAKSNDKIFITGNSRATELENNDLSIRAIQHYLGHSKPNITEIYLHTSEKKSLSKVKEKMQNN
jgi:integrase